MKIFNLFTTSSSIVCIPYVNTFEQLFYFIALRNKEGAMSFFKFLFNLYLTFIEVSGKIRSISWLLCNIGKSFFKKILVLGSIGLNYTKLGSLASSVRIFLTLENIFLALVGL